MAASYLHGVETIEISSGVRTVQEVKTAVIGLVGIAPTGPKNTLTIVRNDEDAAQFGKSLPGFTIPQALEHILLQGSGTILVVNVFDANTHTTAVADESKAVTEGKLKLGAAPIGPVTLKKADGTASTYVLGTDYQLDAYGNFTVIKGRIAENETIKFSYKKLNVNGVTDADIIGDIGADGIRSGVKAFEASFNKFGYNPKILIAPKKSFSPAIAHALLATAEKLRAVVPLDCAPNLTVQDVIESRGTESTTSFFTSNPRAILLYPYVKAYDAATDTNADVPFSGFFAGMLAKTDRDFGYWFSPSNKLMNGVTGLTMELSASINDPDCDVNVLNEAGITTVFNSFGTGFLSWGNRNASFPTSTSPLNFIVMRRIADVVHESLEQAAMQFTDRPINQALVDDIRQTGNNFIKVLTGRGALIEGSKVVFDRTDNPDTDLAQGKVKFRIIFMGATPAERITFYSEIDISLYSSLK